MITGVKLAIRARCRKVFQLYVSKEREVDACQQTRTHAKKLQLTDIIRICVIGTCNVGACS